MRSDANNLVALPRVSGPVHDFPVVIIIGGGIVGAAIAAMLAASGKVLVLLIEPFKAGAGITSTNHGRGHSGVWNYRFNTRESIKRNLESLKLLNRIPNVWECSRSGLYCTETALAAAAFEEFFAHLKISFPLADDADATRHWIEPSRYKCFKTREASFNPASLADRLLRFASSTGRCTLVKGAARVLEMTAGERFRVRLSTGRTIQADLVVNATGGWISTLQSELPLWRPDLVWNYWRLMSINSDSIGKERLDRVITIDRSYSQSEPDAGPLAAVPHGPWTVFGMDVRAKRMRSQDEVPPGEDWRSLDLNDPMDEQLWRSNAEHFPVLKELANEDRLSYIKTFPGVYPEIRSAAAETRGETGTPTPYLNKASWQHGGVRGYYPLFGGSATTSIINARDACAYILKQQRLSATDRDEWIERIAFAIPPEGPLNMIWDNHRAACDRSAA